MINFRNQLNGELNFLGSSLDTNDPRPTESSLQRLAELDKQWQTKSGELQSIVSGPISDFNAAYQNAGLPALIVPDQE